MERSFDIDLLNMSLKSLEGEALSLFNDLSKVDADKSRRLDSLIKEQTLQIPELRLPPRRGTKKQQAEEEKKPDGVIQQPQFVTPTDRSNSVSLQGRVIA